MNISYAPIHINNLPPAFNRLGSELPKALVYILIPVELLYFSIYFKLKGYNRLYNCLSFASIAAFWLSNLVAPISCGPVNCLQNFASEWPMISFPLIRAEYFKVAIGTMKTLDIWARRSSLPTYTAGKVPVDWLLALIIITELRYESFTPNHIRVPKNQENFNEHVQLGIHVAAFAILQSLPQIYPTVLALEVLLAIYILWTTIQLALRYKSSPALFGPLYLLDSLTGFWYVGILI
jgi:hypothetical protein